MERAGMTLVADRFVRTDEGRVWDLATGASVHLIVSSAGGVSDERRWAVRCDALARLRHPSLATLLDYGSVGETQRFEAWDCGRIWPGASDASVLARRSAAACLSACGLSTGDLGDEVVYDCDGRAVVVPGPDVGHAVDRVDVVLEVPGLAIVDRAELAPLIEILATDGRGRPRVALLWGQPGSGLRTALCVLARQARQRGVVPVSADVATDVRWHRVLAGRTLALLGAPANADGWQPLVSWSCRSPHPHVLIMASCEEAGHHRGVRLAPLAPDVLADAVRPAPTSEAARRRLIEIARHAGGLPGPFTVALWGREQQHRARKRGGGAPAAAEAAAAYGTAAAAPDERAVPTLRAWPLPGEVAGWRQRADAAIREIDRGRHAPGVRRLRAVSAGLARRGDWEQAARSALALGSARLRRGHLREAQKALMNAQSMAERAGAALMALDAALLQGIVWIERARMQDAESVLTAVAGAARSAGEVARVARARLALARCLFWQGRYEEGEQELDAIDPSRIEQELQIDVAIVASRLALGRCDVGRATSRASQAVAAAAQLGRPSCVAAAACASAFVHLAAGDLAGLSRDVTAATAAARLAHDPLRALRARLLAAEGARRAGRPSVAAVLLSRIRRLSNVPPVLSARVVLLTDLLAASDSAAVLRRHVASSGLPALALFAPRGLAASLGREPDAVDEVLDVLQVCQMAEDDGALVGDVCHRLRKRLRSSSVGVFILEAGRPVQLAADGGRLESAMAGRVIDARQGLPAHVTGVGIEGGVPIRYAGEIVGAIVARWTLDATVDPARVGMVLAMSAVAMAPAVAAAMARRSAPRPDPDTLLGVSPAIADVRRAIERAAAAPFPVLIEGESGSGKELVARAIHRHSPRRDRPWCTLNCAALPEDLVESELFGHARGAFTGALSERRGVFEEAHTGTLFLDEVGELSARAQAKLLRTIQEGELRRVGENVSRRVDVRLIAATNRDLRQETAAGRFRLDLLYRLDVVRIVIPPLRERRDDIAMLADTFWHEAAQRVGSRATLGVATLGALGRYDWPGNVRELQNVLASLAVRCPRRGVIPPSALPPAFSGTGDAVSCRLSDARRVFDERFVRAALARTGGHRERAATQLGVSRQGLAKLMSRLGIRSG